MGAIHLKEYFRDFSKCSVNIMLKILPAASKPMAAGRDWRYEVVGGAFEVGETKTRDERLLVKEVKL